MGGNREQAPDKTSAMLGLFQKWLQHYLRQPLLICSRTFCWYFLVGVLFNLTASSPLVLRNPELHTRVHTDCGLGEWTVGQWHRLSANGDWSPYGQPLLTDQAEYSCGNVDNGLWYEVRCEQPYTVMNMSEFSRS